MRSPRLARACRELTPLLHGTMDGAAMLGWVERLVASDRWTSFDRYHETTDTLLDLYQRAGAATEVYPIQTGTHAGTGRWVVTEAADVIGATVELVAPHREQVIDYAANPFQVARWSGATPRGGVELELVVCDAPGDRAVAGKCVLTRAGLGGQGRRWADAGAVAVIFHSDVPNHPEATTWTSFGWGGVPHADGAARPVGLCVSKRLGDRLRTLCDAGDVRVHVAADVRRYVGSHDLVSGLVRGSADPQDEVWVLAHSQEPGALDNAAGVAVAVAIADALERLIAAGALPRPKRTIRLLSGYECYSFFHYAEHVARLQPPLAGVVLDSLGLRPALCGGAVGWRSTIPMSAQFVNRVGERFLRAALRHDNPGYRLRCLPFVPTSDNLLGDPRQGFPCPWLETWDNGGKPYDAYHSSADTVDLLDPRGLACLATAMAGYLYYLADAETADAVELARLETARLRRLVERSATIDDLAADYRLDEQRASLERLTRWIWGGRRAEVLALFDGLSAELRDAVGAKREPRRRRIARAMRLVPRRTAFLSPTLESTPEPIRSRIAAAGFSPWALFWADGRRDLAAIADRITVERGQPVDAAKLADYFAAHAELGYVELMQPETMLTRPRLVRELRALGLRAGMDVMVHSSLSSLGPVEGGAETVIDALLQVIGPRGTLLAPSFHHFAAEVYHPATTPTTNGALAEALWRRREALRSDHPSHAVAAIGPRAADYLADHAANGVWSAESPIGRLGAWGGWILSLGVDHGSTTAYHVAESLLEVPCLDPFGSVDQVVGADGLVREVAGLAWRDGTCPVDPRGLDEWLEVTGRQQRGCVGKAECRLVRARDLIEARRRQLAGVCASCGIRPVARGR